MSKEQRLREMAYDAHLEDEDAERFVKFGLEWCRLSENDWTTDRGYMQGSWCKRFKEGSEYCFASGSAMMALIHVDGMENAERRLCKALDDFNGVKACHLDEARARLSDV